MRPPIRFTVALDFLPPEIALGDPARLISEEFLDAARAYYQRRFDEGFVDVEPAAGGVTVVWTPTEAGIDPLEYAVELLQRHEHRMGVAILNGLLETEPENPVVLFNLGMAESDLGDFEDAIAHLSTLVAQDPHHVHGHVALGVAQARSGQTDVATHSLREAVRLAPEDPFARRNLGGLLAKQGLFEEAESNLREAVGLNPTDQQSLFGLARILLASQQGETIEEVDALLRRAIESDPDTELAEQCRAELSHMAERTFRGNAAGRVRMDAVMYCLGAMQTFGKMSKDEIRRITFEIAILGMRGLDVNDPVQKYQIRSLPGRFSGLHLLSIEYVGFKIVDPSVDLGFDLSEEYRQAQALFGAAEDHS